MQKPLCNYFNKCGGCSSQNISYELQLKNKLKTCSSLLKIPEEKIQVYYDEEYNYRNRMDFIFHKKGLGFRAKGKWYKIIDVGSCLISNEKLNKLLTELRNFFIDIDSFDLVKKTGTYRYAVIRTPNKSSSISFILNPASNKISEAQEKIKAFSKITSAENMIVGYVKKESDISITDDFFIVKGEEYLEESLLDKTFKFHSQGFFQNNSIMAEKMISYVKDVLSKYQNNCSLLDLYAGVGTFGISCNELFKEVFILESSPASIECAKLNINLNKAKNSTAFLTDAKNFDKINFKKPLAVITDPPRTGMHKDVIQKLIKADPEFIFYISCNPVQLAKELPYFTGSGYKLNSFALFDLFPQTNHMELIVELKKNK